MKYPIYNTNWNFN